MVQAFSKAAQLGLLDKKGNLLSAKKIRSKARRNYLDRALVAWSIIVRRRDRGICQWCGSSERVQAHHIVARGIANNAGHCALDNGMTLCYQCHFHKLKQDAEQYVVMRDEWLKARGLNYNEMRKKWAVTPGGGKQKLTNDEWRGIAELLERQAKGNHGLRATVLSSRMGMSEIANRAVVDNHGMCVNNKATVKKVFDAVTGGGGNSILTVKETP